MSVFWFVLYALWLGFVGFMVGYLASKASWEARKGRYSAAAYLGTAATFWTVVAAATLILRRL